MVELFAAIDYAIGVLFLAVAVPVIWLGRRSAVHWALAGLLATRGLENLVQGIALGNPTEFWLHFEKGLEHAMLATFALFAAVFASVYGRRTGSRTTLLVGALGFFYTMLAVVPGWAYTVEGSRVAGGWVAGLQGLYDTLRLLTALWVLVVARQSNTRTVRASGSIIAAGMAFYSAFEVGSLVLAPLCNSIDAHCFFRVDDMSAPGRWLTALVVGLSLLAWAWAPTWLGSSTRAIAVTVLSLAALNTIRRLLVVSTDLTFALEMDDWLSRGLIILQPMLLVYGILRYQILGLDAKVKFTIKQSTLVAIFVGFFVAVTQITGAYMEDVFGSSVIGVLATGLLFIAFSPLRRFAERVSSAAVPGAQPVADMGADARQALFREQLEFAWADGTITLHERKRLEQLRSRLEISPEASARIEAKLMGA